MSEAIFEMEIVRRGKTGEGWALAAPEKTEWNHGGLLARMK